jgi:hypothetical protein
LVAAAALPKVVRGLVAGVVAKQVREAVVEHRVAPDTYLATAHIGFQMVLAETFLPFKALRV